MYEWCRSLLSEFERELFIYNDNTIVYMLYIIYGIGMYYCRTARATEAMLYAYSTARSLLVTCVYR